MEAQSPGLANLAGTVFIVTYGRSGSTLLQRMLQTIPQSRIVGENHQTLFPLMLASNRASLAKEQYGDRNPGMQHPWFGTAEIDPDRFTRRLVDAFVDEVINPPPDTRWYGFKEIRYIYLEKEFDTFLDWITEWFPNAHFVFNSRNAEDVRKSRWWTKQNPQKVTRLLHRMDNHFAKYTEANPDRCFYTRYEEFTEDLTCIEPLFDMLGEPFDPIAIKNVMSERLNH